MQYTIRGIPKDVDRILRRRAKQQRRSLNDVVLEAIAIGAGASANGQQPVKYRDLSDIAGSWVEDPEFDKIMAELDQVDPRDWE